MWQVNPVTHEGRELQHDHQDVVLWFTRLSGSGKSTLASLIARFWALEGGPIRVGSDSQRIDTAQMDASHWQSYLSVVFQQSHVLNDTIPNNLRVAPPDADSRSV